MIRSFKNDVRMDDGMNGEWKICMSYVIMKLCIKVKWMKKLLGWYLHEYIFIFSFLFTNSVIIFPIL